MPSEHRMVEIAAGHPVRLRLARAAASRPGFVVVKSSHRAPFEVEQQRWDRARRA